jgi:hypothetical protein
MVTLVWNAEDVAGVNASLFKKDLLPYLLPAMPDRLCVKSGTTRRRVSGRLGWTEKAVFAGRVSELSWRACSKRGFTHDDGRQL